MTSLTSVNASAIKLIPAGVDIDKYATYLRAVHMR